MLSQEIKNKIKTKGRVLFSDRMTAVLSGTSRQGNSLLAPIKAVHESGLIPKSMLPTTSEMTWDEYHDPEAITPKMIGLGKEFTERFKINYERVDEIFFKELLKDDMLNVAGYAWPQPVNGEYPRTENYPNHSFMIYKNPAYYVFDHYYDNGQMGDFIKKLADDYDLMDYAYRIFISSEGQPKKTNWFKDILKNIGNFMLALFSVRIKG